MGKFQDLSRKFEEVVTTVGIIIGSIGHCQHHSLVDKFYSFYCFLNSYSTCPSVDYRFQFSHLTFCKKGNWMPSKSEVNKSTAIETKEILV